jgi:alkanesulfonate monooxygenase SsuD/methylene tetrahydromethanopterin reductase-like flavin-dependent oxidoreductase (luciferase family)
MKIGIGLPATIPGVDGALIIEWARKADAGPFSSLSVLDRLVFPNYEPVVALAAAAGATRRIRLLPSVLLAPLRNAGVLAKELASLDALSGGRLTLGLGVGAREDEFLFAPADFHTRGRRFEAQLALMKQVWAGEPAGEGIGPIGPTPAQAGGPPILIGGFAPRAIARAAKWGVGFIAGGAPPEFAVRGYQLAEAAWQEAGRPGRPLFVGGTYVAVGEELRERGGAYLRQYYAAMGPQVEGMVQAMPMTPQAIKDRIKTYEDIGIDELLLWPTVPELDQVDRLAEIVG